MSEKKHIILAALLFLIALLLHYRYISDYPSYKHAWAQADRFALAKGFVDNDLNLFKPQSLIYNHQFPDQWHSCSESRISAVDFPINDYIPAFFMKICYSESPAIFRIYVLIISLFGLFFLFKLTSLLNPNNTILNLFIVFFGALSPVFVYYQCNFLPSVPCVSFTLIGMYYYVKYLHDGNNKDFLYGLLFLTLSSLARLLFAVPLVAMFCTEIVRAFKRDIHFKTKIIPIIVSACIIVGYFLYNSYLRSTYGSDFLSSFNMPSSFDELQKVIIETYNNWFFSYFTKLQYIVLLLIVLCSVVFFFKNKTKQSQLSSSFSILLCFMLIGGVLAWLLMANQFVDHDYYFLDVFYIPILFLLSIAVSFLPKFSKIVDSALFIVVPALIIVMFISANNSQKQLHKDEMWYESTIAARKYSGANELFDKFDINKEAKILALTAFSPNLPFVMMDRTGYVLLGHNAVDIERALTWNYDYVVYLDTFFIDNIYAHYPSIINKLKRVGGDSKMTICKHIEDSCNTLRDLWGYSDSVAVIDVSLTFDDPVDESVWYNYYFLSDKSFSGLHSSYMIPSIEYGTTYSAPSKNITDKERIAFFSAQYMSDTALKCAVVLKIETQDSLYYYEEQNISQYYHNIGSWEKISMIFHIPQIKCDETKITFFIWNKSENTFFYDDFDLEIL